MHLLPNRETYSEPPLYAGLLVLVISLNIAAISDIRTIS